MTERRYILGELVKLYPSTFFLAGVDRVPLKVGTTRELVAAGVGTRAELGIALSIYTSNLHYLDKIREGAVRIGLDGQAAGVVTAEDELAAIAKMFEIEAKTAAELESVRQRRLEQKAAREARRQAEGAAESAVVSELAPKNQCGSEKPAPARAIPESAAPIAPKRLSLSDLKTAAQARQATPERKVS
jgi:ProP effector